MSKELLVEAEVEYMNDLDVQWISLVNKGANRTPFKIIKNENTKEELMEDVIQSIIIPSSKSIDDYKEKHEWAKLFKVEKTENHEVYNKYINIPLEKLDNDSIRLVKLSKDDDAFALIGKPLEIEGEFLVYKGIMDSPMEVDVPDGPAAVGGGYVQTFGDLFFEELDNLLKVVIGTMELSEMANKMKKSIVFNSLDSFKSFLAAGLDTSAGQVTVAKREKILSDGSEVNMGDNVEKTVDVEITKTEPEVVEVEKNDAVLKSSEKMVELLTALVEKIDKMAEKKEEVVSPVEKAEEDKPVEKEEILEVPYQKIEDTLNAIKTQVEKLEQKIELMDGEVPEPSVVVEKAQAPEPAKKSSPFSGIFGSLNQ
jgi:hypothetical protein